MRIPLKTKRIRNKVYIVRNIKQTDLFNKIKSFKIFHNFESISSTDLDYKRSVLVVFLLVRIKRSNLVVFMKKAATCPVSTCPSTFSLLMQT